MKLIFLDYDGVINTLMFEKGNLTPRFYFPEDNKVNNFQAVMWLNKLCLETGAKIVVTSSWRLWDNYIEVLYQSGLMEGIEVIGKTENLGDRDVEIREYLSNQTEPIESYVVLDDDRIIGFEKHQVKCDIYTGFNFREYRKALKILA